MNCLFEAFIAEKEPVFDIAVITDDGTEMWKNPLVNNANNSHSVTKLFVATAIGQLCDRGLLSVDTKVTSLFDDSIKPAEMSPLWDKVTVADLLRHRAGLDEIPYNIDNDDCLEKIGKDFLKYIFSLPIMHEPGTYRQYSDEAYYLLGRVIHAVTGKTADEYMKENIMEPLGFRQWAMVKCPQGYPVCGGGFFARSDDVARLGWAYANGGMYNGKSIISEKWINEAMNSDYALSFFRDTDICLKTGACGQIVAFSRERRSAAAWHGYATDNGKRNDRLLEAYCRLLDERFGRL